MTPQRDPTAASSPSPSVESGNPCPSVIQTPPPGYKRTEVGVIPEDWEVRAIGGEVDLLTGYPFPSNQYTASGTKLLRGSNIKRGYIDWSSDLTQYWNEVSPDLSRYVLQEGDLVIAMDGSLVGRSYAQLSEEDLPALLLQRVARLRSDQIDVGYLKEHIGSKWFVKYCDSVKTSTAIPHISANDIKGFKIPVPPTKEEQRAIAEVLSDVDALLTSLGRLIAKKRAIKQGAMQQLLTGKTRLPGFTGEWKIQPFDQVFRKQNAKSYQIPTSEYLEHGVYPVIDQGKALIVAYSDLSKKLYHCPLDGVIIFGDHTRIVKYADFDFLVGADGTQLLTVQENCSTKFFYYQLSVKEIPNTGYNRHLKFLKEFLFEVPPLPEQRAIAEVLSDMDAEIAALEARREKTRAIKQGMMQELLTGRIRLIENG